MVLAIANAIRTDLQTETLSSKPTAYLYNSAVQRRVIQMYTAVTVKLYPTLCTNSINRSITSNGRLMGNDTNAAELLNLVLEHRVEARDEEFAL